jgi:Protein of unknown function (DUF3301)
MYFDISAILWITLVALLGYYWFHAMRSKEIALKAAEQHCQLMEVQFLDQTAYLKLLRLKRDVKGHLNFMREYYFEFTVTGEDRYFGHVFMLGNRVQSINLDPHRIH